MIPTNLYKFTFIPLLSLQRNRKQESIFQQVGGLVKYAEFNRL